MVSGELFDRKYVNLWTYKHKRQLGAMTSNKLQRYHWDTCAGDQTQPALIIEEAAQCSQDNVAENWDYRAKNNKAKREADLQGFYTDAALIDDDIPK